MWPATLLLWAALLLPAPAISQLALPGQEWQKALERGQQLQREGRFDEAEVSLVAALKAAEQQGLDTIPVAACLNGLAIFYHSRRNFAGAEPLYVRTLSILEAKLGSGHARVGVILRNLGELYLNQSRWAEAEERFRRALEITESELSPGDPALLEPLAVLAELNLQLGRFEEAIRLQQRSLAIHEKTSGPNHADTLNCRNDLGVVYGFAGRFELAEMEFRRALERAQASSSSSTVVPRSLRHLAEVYRAGFRLAEAEDLLSRSVAIHRAQDPVSLGMATALGNQADLYRIQGLYSKAEEMFQESLRLWERVAGTSHPEYAAALFQMGSLYRDQGRTAEAEPLFQKSFDIWYAQLGPNHPRVIQVADAYAALLSEAGRTGAAAAVRARLGQPAAGGPSGHSQGSTR
jgi:tetratricopeptide (TPR) repeat protein